MQSQKQSAHTFLLFFPIYHGRIGETLSSIVTPLLQKLSETYVFIIKTKKKKKLDRRGKRGRKERRKKIHLIRKNTLKFYKTIIDWFKDISFSQ